MNELDDLYQDLLIEHARKPRNHHALAQASHHAQGHNPLCGDQLEVYVKIENDVVTEVAFESKACAICTASASMMTEVLTGLTLAEAQARFDCFHQLLTEDDPPENVDDLHSAASLVGVHRFPMRVKCATLPWHTFAAAIKGQEKAVTEEPSE